MIKNHIKGYYTYQRTISCIWNWLFICTYLSHGTASIHNKDDKEAEYMNKHCDTEHLYRRGE